LDAINMAGTVERVVAFAFRKRQQSRLGSGKEEVYSVGREVCRIAVSGEDRVAGGGDGPLSLPRRVHRGVTGPEVEIRRRSEGR
ncbi:hypothetical protein CERSUDRAFT_116078, partial [Gelatoporia subvermispora B]